MARKGENIYKRKDGRWEARYIKGYKSDGKAKYGYCYGKSYRQTKEKVSQMKATTSCNQMISAESARKQLSQYCDEWLMFSRVRIKESTYAKYQSVIEKHIKPRLGDFHATALTSLVMEKFTRELLWEEELSAKTVKDILVLLKSILRYMNENYGGVLPKVEIVYPKEKKREMRVLSKEEQAGFSRYLMTDMDDGKFGALLALMTGLRIGEVCALRWKDISLDEQTIRVSSTMQRLKNMGEGNGAKTKILINAPKSDASARIIPLTDYTLELCRMRKAQSPDAFVLTGEEDRFMEPRTLQYRFEKYTRDCALEGVHFHTLRHSFATRCVEVDFEIKSLSEILGHSSPKITLERYVHSSLELKRSNMNKLAAIGY